MKKSFLILLLLITCVVGAIKFVPPVNDLAREKLPEGVLKLIGEKPKNFIERIFD